MPSWWPLRRGDPRVRRCTRRRGRAIPRRRPASGVPPRQALPPASCGPAPRRADQRVAPATRHGTANWAPASPWPRVKASPARGQVRGQPFDGPCALPLDSRSLLHTSAGMPQMTLGRPAPCLTAPGRSSVNDRSRTIFRQIARATRHRGRSLAHLARALPMALSPASTARQSYPSTWVISRAHLPGAADRDVLRLFFDGLPRARHLTDESAP